MSDNNEIDDIEETEKLQDDIGTQGDKPKHPGGRPTKYDPKYHPILARSMAKHGHTIDEMAVEFDVNKTTIYEWMDAHEEFSNSIGDGRNFSDDRTERSLYERANGYTYVEDQPIKVKSIEWIDGHKCETEEVKIVPVTKVVPPDFQSLSLWLRNRRPKTWRDKTEIAATVDIDDSGIDESLLSDEEQTMLKDLRRKAYLKSIENGN